MSQPQKQNLIEANVVEFKFEERFTVGDIICSDRFHDGLCMVVNRIGNSAITKDFVYYCDDLVKPDQGWVAHEVDSLFKRTYNWHIASDDEIAKYLSKYVEIKAGKVGTSDVLLLDDGILLHDEFGDKSIFFSATELAQLEGVIQKHLVR